MVELRRWMGGVALVVAAVAFVGIPARATYGAHTTADEPQYLLSALSLFDDLDLDISDELADEAYLPFHEIPVDPQTVPLDETGREVSPHDPLLPWLLALPMGLGGWVAAKATLALVAAACAALTVWVAVRRFEVTPATGGVVAAATFTGIPLAAYGTQVYPEMPAALAMLAAFALVTAPRRAGRDEAVLAGAALVALVALPWLSIKYLPGAVVVGAALVLRSRHRPRLAVGVVGGAALAGVVFLALHQWIYGGWTAYASGDHFAETGEFSVVGTQVDPIGRSRRLVGLLVDRTFGIAAWSPIWWMLPFAVGAALAAIRRGGPERLALAALAAVWLNATFVALTMHGWWVPGRQLVVGLPLAALLVARLVDGSVVRLRLAAVLGVVGATNWLWLAIESSTDRRTLVVDFADTAAPALRLVGPLLPDGLRAGTADTVSLLAWAVAVVAVVVWSARQPGDRSDRGRHRGVEDADEHVGEVREERGLVG